MRPLLVVVVSSLLFASCATTQETASGPGLRVKDYYPLALGRSWTYRISPAMADRTEGEITVISEQDGVFSLNVGGKLSAYATSISDGKRILLEEPLEVGHTWVAVPDPAAVERYTIVATGVEKRVPAGTFPDCVQVRIVEDVRDPAGNKGQLVGVWTYARGVGPVHFVQTVSVGGGPPQETAEYKLLQYSTATP
jgi:hypothetical protein